MKLREMMHAHASSDADIECDGRLYSRDSVLPINSTNVYLHNDEPTARLAATPSHRRRPSLLATTAPTALDEMLQGRRLAAR